MNIKQPMAQAVAVTQGKILAVGSDEDILRDWKAASTEVVDLAGKTLLPGFIDGHSHFMNAPQMLSWANVSLKPVGPVESIADILQVLVNHRQHFQVAPGEWIIGYGYDGNGLSDGRELTGDDLDPQFPDNPIMLIHVSNHGAVCNSTAFKILGFTAATPTPPNSVVLRKPGTNEPAGLTRRPDPNRQYANAIGGELKVDIPEANHLSIALKYLHEYSASQARFRGDLINLTFAIPIDFTVPSEPNDSKPAAEKTPASSASPNPSEKSPSEKSPPVPAEPEK